MSQPSTASIDQIRLALKTQSGSALNFVVRMPETLGLAPELASSASLDQLGGQAAGVSKYHALLNLDPGGKPQVVDLHSTNATWVNDVKVLPGTPVPVCEGDSLKLGTLTLKVSFEEADDLTRLSTQVEPIWTLTTIAKALTSQLELDFILQHILQLTRTLTAAGEALVWLMDEPSEELYLRAELGIEEERIRHMRLPVSDPLVSSVLDSGLPLRTSRSVSGAKVKIKTGYLVEALLYVPLIVGPQKLGVLAAVHRDYDATFSSDDELVLAAIGDFAAIAIQNASIHQQVQHLNRIKDEMIQNISHEFRTPLQYFRGYVSLMLEEKDRLHPTHYEYLKILDQQADRLRWLINNFVSLDNLHTEEIRFVPVDMNYVLSSTVHSAQLLARSKEITLTYRQGEHLPPVRGHLSRLFEVVDNLLGNALKFTPAGGTIEVSSEVSENRQNIIVRVKDSGIGIDPEHQARIFDRFYQVDGTPSRQHGGVGIGLAVCKSIVEQHNGHIGVDSTPGQGATFTFSLPVMTGSDVQKYA